MKFTVDYPIVVRGYDPALVTAAGMTRVARAVEAGGCDAISFSQHPAPSAKRLNAGGHESLDQTSALAQRAVRRVARGAARRGLTSRAGPARRAAGADRRQQRRRP